jgi:hypothetical protein
MKTRVTNTNRRGAHRYIGRGIDIDPRWRSFAAFLADMGERPAGTTLERNNNDLGYWPGNCCWATNDAQASNTSRNVWVTLDGEAMLFSKAAKKLGKKNYSPSSYFTNGNFTDHQTIINYWAANEKAKSLNLNKTDRAAYARVSAGIVIRPRKARKLDGFLRAGARAAEIKRNRTHCPSGHEFNEANTRFNKRGARICRACERVSCAKHLRKKAEGRARLAVAGAETVEAGA